MDQNLEDARKLRFKRFCGPRSAAYRLHFTPPLPPTAPAPARTLSTQPRMNSTTAAPSELQVIILAGPEAAQRAIFGFSTALAAAASGVAVRVVLSMHGAFWGAETTGNAVTIPDFPPVCELIEQLLELDVPIEACSTCVDNFCPSAIDGDGRRVLRRGIDRVGLGLVAMRMAGANTVVC